RAELRESDIDRETENGPQGSRKAPQRRGAIVWRGDCLCHRGTLAVAHLARKEAPAALTSGRPPGISRIGLQDASMAQSPVVFDRHLLHARRARAAALGPSTFLVDRVAEDFSDRLATVLRRFERVVDL